MFVSDSHALTDKDISVDTESSSTETSTSDTDFKDEIKHEIRKARATEAEAIRGTAFVVTAIDIALTSCI